MAAVSTSLPVNTAAIAQASASAVAAHYIIPSVQTIIDAGKTFDQVNQSLLWTGQNLDPAAIFPEEFNGLYYNISFLWPQLQITGPILDTQDYCLPEVCSLLWGNFLYLPSIPANAFFAAIFALLLLISVGLSIKQRVWGYMIGMVCGLLCETLGYIGRILIAQNDFTGSPFDLYIVCLTIGPAFLSFSIYTCLARIVIVYGKDLSRFKPKTYTYVFAVCDLISLVLQASGGGIASTAKTISDEQRGINIMIGGLVFQVVSLSLYLVVCAELAYRVYRHRNQIEPKTYHLRQSWQFKGFMAALGLATLTIYIRSCFRVAELQSGFQSAFANNEVTFMVLEAGMITIASLALTSFHPALVFGSQWRALTAIMRNKSSMGEMESIEAKVANGPLATPPV